MDAAVRGCREASLRRRSSLSRQDLVVWGFIGHGGASQPELHRNVNSFSILRTRQNLSEPACNLPINRYRVALNLNDKHMNELYESIFHAVTEIDNAHLLNDKHVEGQTTLSNHVVRDLLLQARNILLQASAHVWATGTGAPTHRRFQHPIETIDAADGRWTELVESQDQENF